jgi:hypothetical protein
MNMVKCNARLECLRCGHVEQPVAPKAAVRADAWPFAGLRTRKARPARDRFRAACAKGKTVLTIKLQDERARFETGAAAMISDLQKLVVLPVAMILFLCAASTSPGLIWRGSAPAQIVAAR